MEAALSLVPAGDLELDSWSPGVQDSMHYHKSGNLHCKQIFVVNDSYEKFILRKINACALLTLMWHGVISMKNFQHENLSLL